MEIQENMAAVIHALKEKRGQSLTELSEDLEISRSALQEYLAGNGNPTLATVEHLAERLGIPSVALVSGTLPSGQFDVLMTLLDSLKLLSGLSADQRRRFTELLGEMLTLWEGGEARERGRNFCRFPHRCFLSYPDVCRLPPALFWTQRHLCLPDLSPLQHDAAPGIPILLRSLRTTAELEALCESDHY